MEIQLGDMLTVGGIIAAAAGTVLVTKNDNRHLAKAQDDTEKKRAEQATEIFRRLNALETSRPTHDDLETIKENIKSMDDRVRTTETGVATMSVKIENIEKSISRVSHLCSNTNSLVQLLVLNSPGLTSKEKSDFISSSTREVDAKP